jgi:hypothetical protein
MAPFFMHKRSARKLKSPHRKAWGLFNGGVIAVDLGEYIWLPLCKTPRSWSVKNVALGE